MRLSVMFHLTHVFTRPKVYWALQPVIALAAITDGLVRLGTLGILSSSFQLEAVRLAVRLEYQALKEKDAQ